MNDKTIPTTTHSESSTLTYRGAGVDIDAGNSLIERIKPIVKQTARSGVMGSIGGFGGLFELPWQDYTSPVLVTGTDGVGTKLHLAIAQQEYSGIGIDLVAMCVNDIIVTGAEPLLFLDYYATSKLDVDIATTVISGIAEGCKLAGAALAGGETAEMPGMYHRGDFDLAGFAVGIVEKPRIIDGSLVTDGDVIIGLASSGPHSNGFSLVNKVLERADELEQESLDSMITALLQPTRIYVKSVLQALNSNPLKALAHITGGGLLENIPRVLPKGLNASIDTNNWTRTAVFKWLKETGNIDIEEMYRVFNCGIGMAVIVAPEHADSTIEAFIDAGESAFQIGYIIKSATPGTDSQVYLENSAHF